MTAMARQVISSVSTTIFSTFACDYVEDLEVNLLRADYSISCDDEGHLLFQVWLILKPNPPTTLLIPRGVNALSPSLLRYPAI